MAVTIKDIAEIAGVSRGTVDRALNRRGRISPEKEKRILEIAEAEGYFKSHSKKQINKRIAVITQLTESAFMTPLLEGVDSAAKRQRLRNVEVITKGISGVCDVEQALLIDEMLNRNIDGLAIMASDSPVIREKLKEVNSRNIPIVTFNTDVKGGEREFYIGMNNRQSGRTAAGLMNMMLCGKGNVVIINGNFTNDEDNQRVEGFTEEVISSFPDIILNGVHPCFDKEENAKKIIEGFIDTDTLPDGIFMVSSGQQGIKQSLKNINPSKRPKVIVYDNTPKNEELLKEGYVDFVLGQQSFLQGYQTVTLLADLVCSGKKPESKKIFTETIISTKYNI